MVIALLNELLGDAAKAALWCICAVSRREQDGGRPEHTLMILTLLPPAMVEIVR
jgi:hypothetical protein